MFRRGFSVVWGVISAVILLAASASLVQAAIIPITITDTAFVPATVTITAGDSLEFRNSTTATQSARTTVASGFNTGDIGANQTKSVVVTNVGTYTYSSAYSSALSGTVTVTAATAAATATPSGTTQPTQTQAQPVSGVFEVVVAMTLVGMAMMMGGFVWQRRLAHVQPSAEDMPLVNVPRLTLRRDDDE